MIRSPDKNSFYLSENAMQLLPVLPEQLGHKFDLIQKRSKVILVSSFEQTLIVGFVPNVAYQDSALRFLSSGE